jgi:DMSO/TMAO reductase YedYZ molybdopterin-dependent catalytic subunit
VAPRFVDWGIALVLAVLFATGVGTLFAGDSGSAWVFTVHGACGFVLAGALVVKLRRVGRRLVAVERWERGTYFGALATAFVVLALASGWAWAAGANVSLGGYSLLSWHFVLGLALVAVVAVHMALRARGIRRRDIAHRRQFLVAGGAALGALAVWRAQRPVEAFFGLRGAKRRFTGSYEVASFEGNAFPTTSWVADNPRLLDPAGYRLAVAGRVRTPRQLALADLDRDDELVATLDCTGGFYSTQRWRGTTLERVIASAGPLSDAHHVRVVSHTGYRWSFPRSHASKLLLATRVGGEPISHDHGAPVRLVAPGRRGFQWVKWVERIELHSEADYGAPASTIWSSFTGAGRGA